MADASRRGISPDDSLPPVEPPSAGFLVQLFLVPALIVGIIIFVWLAFHWLAQLGNDPQAYVRELRRNSEGRWQAALNLALDLRVKNSPLKADVGLAGELASILQGEATSGRVTGGGHAAEQSRVLCVYLCRALGEFAVPEAAAPLVARAEATDQPEIARAAVEALAVLAANLAAAGKRFPDHAAVTAAVMSATRSTDHGLRSTAAYALGVVDGRGARERLQELCGDGEDDVRYNAALGLARLGDAAAWDTLAEMLALPDVAVADATSNAERDRILADRYRRLTIVLNAIKGACKLVDQTNEPPPDRITAAITALDQDSMERVRKDAAELIGRINRLPASPAGSR